MAYDFNGTSDNLEIASALLSATPLTIFARFKTDTIAAGTAVIAALSGSSGSHAFQLRRSGSSLHASATEGGTTGSAVRTAVLSTGVEYAATAVFSSATSRTIHLEANFGSNTTSVTPTSLDRTNVGALYDAGALGSFFDGAVCEVAFWNEALTQSEHFQMRAGLPPILVRPSALVAYFPMVRNTNDIKAQQALTVSGATVVDHFSVRRAPRRRM